MKQIDMKKSIVALAMALCIGLLGIIGGAFLTLWNEGWLMSRMESSGYFADIALRTKADCGLVISQAGVLGNFVDEFVSDEEIRQDVTMAADALFRNSTPPVTSHFGTLATRIEDVIYKETGMILGESQKQSNIAVQFQTEQQYAQSIRPPFQAILSILLQYKKVGLLMAIGATIVGLGGFLVLFWLSKTMQQLMKTVCCSFLGGGVALAVTAVAAALSGYQKWMPQSNLEYTLFVEWLGGVPLAFGAMALLCWLAAAAIAFWGQKNPKSTQ